MMSKNKKNKKKKKIRPSGLFSFKIDCIFFLIDYENPQ